VAIAPACVAMTQVTFGVAVVLSMAPLWLVTVHHATGAVLLASLVLAWAALDDDSSAPITNDRRRP
jgi:heme A synthase